MNTITLNLFAWSIGANSEEEKHSIARVWIWWKREGLDYSSQLADENPFSDDEDIRIAKNRVLVRMLTSLHNIEAMFAVKCLEAFLRGARVDLGPDYKSAEDEA